MAKRERLGIKPGQGKDVKKGQSSKKKLNRCAVSTVKKELKEFKDSFEERILSAIKKVQTKDEGRGDDVESVDQNAGTLFGGRKSKRAKKE
jgi:hypothetical protein